MTVRGAVWHGLIRLSEFLPHTSPIFHNSAASRNTIAGAYEVVDDLTIFAVGSGVVCRVLRSLRWRFTLDVQEAAILGGKVRCGAIAAKNCGACRRLSDSTFLLAHASVNFTCLHYDLSHVHVQ